MKLLTYLKILSLFSLFFLLFPTNQSLAFSLDESVKLALRNNPDLHKQQMDVDFSSTDLADQRGQKFGKLDFVSSYTHYNLPHTLAPLTPGAIASNPAAVPTTEDLFTSGIVYEVPLFTGFSHTRSVEIARLQKKLASTTLRLSKEQLIYNVKTLYVNTLALQAQQEAQKTYIESLQQLYDQVTRELQLGQKARVDKLKAEADLEAARAARDQLKSNIRILKASLASLLNLEQIPPLEPITLVPEAVKVEQNDFSTQISASQRLHAAQLIIDKSSKQADKAAAAFYPQIVLSTSYGQNFGPNDSGHPDSGDWNHQEVWQAGLSLKWSIFDFGSTRNKLKKARIIEQQSRYEQTRTILELKRAIKEAVTRINAAVSDYQSAQTELHLTQQTVAIEQVRFDQGAASINDLLYAQARNQLAQSRFISAGYNYKTARFQLEYLLETGEKR